VSCLFFVSRPFAQRQQVDGCVVPLVERRCPRSVGREPCASRPMSARLERWRKRRSTTSWLRLTNVRATQLLRSATVLVLSLCAADAPVRRGRMTCAVVHSPGGLFVLEDVVPPEVCSQLAVKMLADAAAIVAHGGWATRGEFGHGHLQLGQPRMAPHVHPSIVANGIVEQVVVAILRRPAVLGFCNGNCAMPGSGIQRLHMDDQWDYHSAKEAAAAGEPWPHRTTSVHVNVCPTGDVSEHNGATEVWPGSHKWHTAPRNNVDPLADAAFVEEHRRLQPPTRNCFPAGAVVFRDARIWVSTPAYPAGTRALWAEH